jgi:hypothetical protein
MARRRLEVLDQLYANNRSSKAALDPCHALESEFTELGLRMGLAIGARNQSLM